MSEELKAKYEKLKEKSREFAETISRGFIRCKSQMKGMALELMRFIDDLDEGESDEGDQS